MSEIESHGRLPWWRPEDLTPEARELYERITGGPRRSESVRSTDPEGRLQGPFNAMLASPAVGGPLQELGAALRYRTSLSPRAREIAILAVAVDARSPFEWLAHEAAGRTAGLTDDELAALRRGQRPAGLAQDEAAVLELVRALIAQRDLDDEQVEALDRATVMELVVLVGYYQLLALSLRVFRTPLPPGAEDPFS